MISASENPTRVTLAPFAVVVCSKVRTALISCPSRFSVNGAPVWPTWMRNIRRPCVVSMSSFAETDPIGRIDASAALTVSVALIDAVMPSFASEMKLFVTVSSRNVIVPLPSSSLTKSRLMRTFDPTLTKLNVPVSFWPKTSMTTSLPVTPSEPPARLTAFMPVPTVRWIAVVFSWIPSDPLTLTFGIATATVAEITP